MYQDDLKNLSEEERKHKLHSLQMEIVMLESDSRKLLAEKNTLDAEIRKLGKDAERLRLTLDEKKKQLEKVAYGITQSDEEIKRLKKKINLL